MFESFSIFVGCAFASWLLGFPIYRLLASYGIVDKPNQRSSHNHPTVRGGGIAIMAVAVLGAVAIAVWHRDLSLAVLAAIATIMAWVSFVDDLKSVSRLIRFGCHATAAVITLGMIGLSASKNVMPTADFLIPAILMGPVLFIWIAGYANAFNFMDGINGIAAAQTIVTAVGAALLGLMAGGEWFDSSILFLWVLTGAALGFLPHNFPRARMFMGDVSSAPLGFLLASLVVWMASKYGWWLLTPLLLLHANYILDTAITLIRRFLRGERWYEAHREHFYQRLVRAGKSHVFVTGWELLLQLLVLGLCVTYLQSPTTGRIGVVAAVLGIWALFFGYAEVVFRRHEREALSPLKPAIPAAGENVS